jgi:hypothetical protein
MNKNTKIMTTEKIETSGNKNSKNIEPAKAIKTGTERQKD